VRARCSPQVAKLTEYGLVGAAMHPSRASTPAAADDESDEFDRRYGCDIGELSGATRRLSVSAALGRSSFARIVTSATASRYAAPEVCDVCGVCCRIDVACRCWKSEQRLLPISSHWAHCCGRRLHDKYDRGRVTA
jgi:hypothetical protein